MRYLGIDFGLKRVGLAVTDPGGKMAFPLKTIHRTTRDKFFKDLLGVIDAQDIQAIVLGLPCQKEGKSLTYRQVENFKNSLMRRTSLPIYTVNEALTSFQGEKILESQKVTRSRKKKNLDQVAAVLILESFLRHEGKEPAEQNEY